MFSKWLSLLLLGFTLTSVAQPENKSPLPWETLRLVGEGKLTVWFWDVYEAQLFSQNGRYQEQAYPLALRLTYLRDFDKKDLVSETRKQWEKLGFKNNDQQQQWLSVLNDQWRDVKEGDSITLYIDGDKTSQFYLNQEALGEMKDQAFSEAFLAIWLSENTSAPKVRKQLIAGKGYEASNQ